MDNFSKRLNELIGKMSYEGLRKKVIKILHDNFENALNTKYHFIPGELRGIKGIATKYYVTEHLEQADQENIRRGQIEDLDKKMGLSPEEARKLIADNVLNMVREEDAIIDELLFHTSEKQGEAQVSSLVSAIKDYKIFLKKYKVELKTNIEVAIINELNTETKEKEKRNLFGFMEKRKKDNRPNAEVIELHPPHNDGGKRR